MAKIKETLSSLFAPPENLHGIGGVLCAYSSDADFLEQALLRFTRVPPGSRRIRVSAGDFFLMLDPSHEIFGINVVPGLLQLRPKFAKDRYWDFKCMHAKVALLAFGPARTGNATLYRVIVGTGNWTMASARQQIELAWYLDIHSLSREEDRWELHAIATFLKNLLGCYQTSDKFIVKGLIDKALQFGTESPASAKISFMASSEKNSLLSQLSSRLKDQAKKCNYLVCGSGFFEQKHDPQEQPKVLMELESILKSDGILNQSINDKLLITNGDIEDQVVAAYKTNALKGWELRHPKDPGSDNSQPRTKLHAKFIFVAKKLQNKNTLSNGWLYLGSGNLSIPGIVVPPPQGNIEAGVIIPTPELDTPRKVMGQLPIGSKFTPGELEGSIQDVGDPLPKAKDQPPSPIILFQIQQDGVLSIVWDTTVPVDSVLQVVLPDGSSQSLKLDQKALKLTPFECPRSLEIHWDGYTCNVPCLDTNGNFKGQTIQNPSFGNWLDLLAGFPETMHDPDPDEDEPDSETPDLNPSTPQSAGAQWNLKSGGRDFPAHTAMMLVEKIADLNGNVPEESAADWISYLRHVLLEMKPYSQIEGWQSLNVNFLAALLSPEGFAPPWKDISKYQDLIFQVAREWGLEEYPSLEVSQ